MKTIFTQILLNINCSGSSFGLPPNSSNSNVGKKDILNSKITSIAFQKFKKWGAVLYLLPLLIINEASAQCTPNTIAFNGSQPIYNIACNDNSYQTIDGSTPTGSGQTYQWEYSLNGGPYILLTTTTEDPKWEP